MIDEELHKNTQYMFPKLKEQIAKETSRVCSFMIDCCEDNWDGYNAAMISHNTIKLSYLTLFEIQKWFEKNIGFLNNRKIDFWSAPNPDGNIHIEVNYDDMFEFNFYVKHGELITFMFHPQPRHTIDGTKTIADRDFKMVFPKDIINDKCCLEGIGLTLSNAFYVHKWRFEEDENHNS